MRTILDEISKQQLYLISFASRGIQWFLMFCCVTVAIWYSTSSMILGMIAGLALPAFIIKTSTDKKITFINNALVDIHNKTLSSLETVDYFYYNANGSIAIDAKHQLISFIQVSPTFEIMPPIIIHTSKITKYAYFDPGMVITKYHGTDMGVTQETANENYKAIAARAEERGIHFEIDDLQNPKIVMNMTSHVADHWNVILNRIIAQTLEPSSLPKFIP